MTANFTLDQELGRKNIVRAGNFKLGETGQIRDSQRTGQMVSDQSGMMVDVMVVMATANLTNPAGLGIKFDAAEYGRRVGALSGAGDVCDGIVDPNIVGNINIGDTFLIFRKGPMPIIASGSISAGAGIRTAANGQFQAATTESAPYRCGRLQVAATGAGQIRRAYCDFTLP